MHIQARGADAIRRSAIFAGCTGIQESVATRFQIRCDNRIIQSRSVIVRDRGRQCERVSSAVRPISHSLPAMHRCPQLYRGGRLRQITANEGRLLVIPYSHGATLKTTRRYGPRWEPPLSGASRATAWRIARDHDWDTLRDAEYLAVTRLQADALPTLAAKAQQVVPVAPPQALAGG
jgi:hypothetical protein